MKKVTHHLTSETLQDYAAGCLSMQMETLVACHLTVCPSCRRNAEIADTVGGALFNSSAEAEVKATAEDILALARKTRPIHLTTPKRTDRLTPGVPAPLGKLLPDSLENLDWSYMAPGIKQFSLTDQPRQQGAFKLLQLEPGTRLIEHSHDTRELTYVIKGSYTDQIGQFKAGDIADLDRNHEHEPVVDEGEICIAVIATESPVKFTGVVGKILQPFVGI